MLSAAQRRTGPEKKKKRERKRRSSMPVNTTSGPVGDVPDRHHSHTLNTSRVLEEDLQYVDEEPEIAHVLPATGWAAAFEDGHREALVLWSVLDTGAVFGVAPGEDGTINASESIEAREGFSGYLKEEN
jgi:hypothetical protein